jgi:RNA polymerase sigma-70 factor (ECF subfamily)
LKNTDDILLLKLLKSGDEFALKHLFDSYFASLCRYMHIYLNDKHEVEENALDIFMYIWEHRTDIEIKVSFKAYLFQAARNRCLNSLRKQQNIVSIEDVLPELKQGEDMSIELQELNNLIEEAVMSLPDKCREVFIDSRTENLTNQEIAAKMEVSVKTVEAQITKALKRIKEHLKNNYYFFL